VASTLAAARREVERTLAHGMAFVDGVLHVPSSGPAILVRRRDRILLGGGEALPPVPEWKLALHHELAHLEPEENLYQLGG
jgi:hypothetical protein